jgi:membrane-associated phospholipid phosphatase
MVRAGIALAFGVVFGTIWASANSLSGDQAERYPLYLGFEQSIPFVPWAMAIYFTLDVLAAIMPFLLRSRSRAIALMVLLIVQVVIAFPFFVWVPIQVGFTGEATSGVWGEFVTDPIGLPNYSQWNHLPSLHVAYSFTIAWAFRREYGARCWWWMALWATVVSVSVLFVHEHHVIDIVAGFALFLLTAPVLMPVLERFFGRHFRERRCER